MCTAPGTLDVHGARESAAALEQDRAAAVRAQIAQELAIADAHWVRARAARPMQSDTDCMLRAALNHLGTEAVLTLATTSRQFRIKLVAVEEW